MRKLLIVLAALVLFPLWAALLLGSLPVHFVLRLFGWPGFLSSTLDLNTGKRNVSYSVGPLWSLAILAAEVALIVWAF